MAPAFDPGFAALNPARILVAEDNAVNQKVIKGLLTRLGYSPTVAGNGREAVAVLRDQAFDVVLMDVEMPEMDGETATRALRAELPAGRQPVVIALTAHALDGRRDRYLAAGMDGYLSKPIRIAELTATLAQIPAMKQRRDS